MPARDVPWDDLAAIFGTRGPGARCLCQRYKLAPRESFGSVPAEVRAERLRDQRGGLVAYVDDEPAGWCAVEPRSAYDGLVRVFRVPWEGRSEDRADSTVWAVTCFLVRAGFRKRGVSRALTAAAVDHARAGGARAIEGYPITTTNVILEELHVGTVGVFADAGFTEVSRPGVRRTVMRIDF